MKKPVPIAESRHGPARCWNMGVEVRGGSTKESTIQPSLKEQAFLTKRLRVGSGGPGHSRFILKWAKPLS